MPAGGDLNWSHSSALKIATLAGLFIHVLNSRLLQVFLIFAARCAQFKVLVICYSVFLNIIGTSQLVVRSALEDSLGLVQWDIGVLLNCLCITLTTLEKYILSRPRQTHTPLLFLQRNVVTLEQDVVIRAIKLAVSDIVHEFGHHLDQVGLNTSAAELCQRAWDRELI